MRLIIPEVACILCLMKSTWSRPIFRCGILLRWMLFSHKSGLASKKSSNTCWVGITQVSNFSPFQFVWIHISGVSKWVTKFWHCRKLLNVTEETLWHQKYGPSLKILGLKTLAHSLTFRNRALYSIVFCNLTSGPSLSPTVSGMVSSTTFCICRTILTGNQELFVPNESNLWCKISNFQLNHSMLIWPLIFKSRYSLIHLDWALDNFLRDVMHYRCRSMVKTIL